MTRRTRLWNALALAWLLIPAAYVVWLVTIYHVNVPTQDDWWILPQIQDFLEGRFHIASVWRPINEHRIFFPQLLVVLLSPLTHWNILFELLASVALTFATCVIILRQTASGLSEFRLFWQLLIFMTSVTIFSLVQNHAWLIGSGLYIYLARFAAIAGFSILSGTSHGKSRLIAAIVLGVVASYSFGTGLNYWASALPVLLLNVEPHRPIRQLAVWIAASVATILFYLKDLKLPVWTLPNANSSANLMQHAEFAAAYLGAALFPRWIAGAAFTGILGFALCVAASIILIRRWRRTARQLAFLWSCVLFALTCACLTAIGRAGFGLNEALSRRYIPNSCLLWIADITLLIEIAALASERKKLPAPWAFGAMAVLALISFPICYSSGKGIVYFQWNYTYLTEAKTQLFHLENDRLLERLLPDKEFVKASCLILKKHHLSVFQN